MRRQQYWAATPRERFGNELGVTLRDYYQTFSGTNHWRVIRELYLAYYGYSPDSALKLSSHVGFEGRQGEVVMASLNKFRALVSHVTTLVTAQRPAFKPVAEKKNVATRESTEKAKAALEYDMRKLGGETQLYRAAERANALTIGGVFVRWNPNGGTEFAIDLDSDNPLTSGQNEYHALGPLDIPRPTGCHWSEAQWLAARVFMNKYDLAATYGIDEAAADKLPSIGEDLEDKHRDMLRRARDEAIELAEEIGQVTCDATLGQRLAHEVDEASGYLEEEMVPVFHWFHKPSPALPDGRECVWLSEKLVFDDGPLRYKQIPIAIMAPQEMIDTSNGYNMACDALAPQRIMDSILSGITSRHDALQFGVLALDKNASQWDQVADGPKVVRVDMATAGSALRYEQLFRMDPGEIGLYQQFAQGQKEIVGVPDAMTGNLPGQESMSGKALALLKMSALEFHSGGQMGWHNMVERVGQIALQNYKTFSQGTFEGLLPSAEKTGSEVGSAQLVRFSSEDLQAVEDVRVEVVNPLFDSATGRQSLADDLKGLVPVGDYIEFLRTGNINIILDPLSKKERLAQQVRDKLRQAVVPVVLPTDSPAMMIEAAIDVMDDLDVREDPAVFQAVMDYIARQGENILPDSTSAKVKRMVAMAQSLGAGMPMPDQQPMPEGAGMPGAGGDGAPQQPDLPADPVSGQVPQGPAVVTPS